MKIKNSKGVTIEITKETIDELAQKFYELSHEYYRGRENGDTRSTIASKWNVKIPDEESPKGFSSTTFEEQMALKFGITREQVHDLLGKLGYELSEYKPERRGYVVYKIKNKGSSPIKKCYL